MAKLKQLYDLHKNRLEYDVLSAKPGSAAIGSHKKYHRDKIINAQYFTKTERDFLDWLLVDEEYTIAEVKNLVRKEMERMVD
ncbi:MAG: hypothetical protein ACOX7J_02680 [Bacillota bacterium]|jgi:hypothetical protein